MVSLQLRIARAPAAVHRWRNPPRLLMTVVLLLLAGCGRPDPGSGAPVSQAADLDQAASPTAAPSLRETLLPAFNDAQTPTPLPVEPGSQPSAITVGLSVEPDVLYSLVSTMSVVRTIEHAFKEPWILSLDYSYTANPRYLQGELPTIDNGGAVLRGSDGQQQLTVTWRMQPDLTWDDGQPLTSEDVVFGHQIGCDPQSQAVSFLVCNKIESVEAVDETTWTVTYRPGESHSLYFATLNGQNLILPRHELGGISAAGLQSDPRVIEHPMGWGPYKIAEDGWAKGSSLTLTRNEHYAGAEHGLPQISQVVFKFIPDTTVLWAAVQAGEIDVVTSDGLQASLAPQIEAAEKAGKLRAFFISSPIWEQLSFNFNRADDLTRPSLLADPAVRHAIAYGANRQGYVDAIYAGMSNVMHSFIPPVSWAYPGDQALTIYPYDAARANQLLDEAGYRDSDGDGIRENDGEPLSFSYRATAGGMMREKLAQLFRDDMQAIGIDIRLEFLPASEWYGNESGLARRNFELGQYASSGEAEPAGELLYACHRIPGPENNWNGQNVMGWCNEVASEAIVRATSALSLQERKEAYVIAQQEFTRDLPSLPLFNRLQIYTTVPDLQNFHPNPSESPTWNIADWTLVQR